MVITQGQLGLKISFRSDGEKQEFEFEKGKITIGRRKGCDVVIQNSSVSRLHATVKLEKGRWILRDNGSANGLAVRGNLLKSHPLSDDRVLMGDVAVHFQIKLPVGIGGNVLHSEQKLSSSISVDNLDTLLETMLGDAPTKDRDTTQLGLREPTSLNAADIILIMRAATDAFLAHDDLDSILNQVLDLIFEHLPVNQASVLLLDHQTAQLMPHIQRAARGKSTQQIRISRHIANEAVTSKKAVLVMDAEQDPRFDASASIVSLGIRSAMAAPLCHKGKVSGLIYIDRRASNVFTHSHLEVLSILASLSAAAVDRAMLHAKIERERKIRERLSRYNAPAVIDRIVSADDLEACAMSSEEREVTVLFADISGFTSLSENMPARAVTELLNEIFQALTEEVFKEDGTLDKFIGDAVMVFFGAPLDQEDHAARAVRVALAMQKRIAELNQSRDPDEQFGIRIGINSGPVVVGDVGALQRKDYTVIGDTVNTACRIESFISLDGQVVIGAATYAAVKDEFDCTELAPVELKGKAEALTTYRVEGVNGLIPDVD